LLAIYRLYVGRFADPATEDQMATPSGLRIGDADREAVAGSLREHYAHGRLTLDEFQERLDATFAAKTDNDLGRITSDLPHPVVYGNPWPPAQRAVGRQRGSGWQRSGGWQSGSGSSRPPRRSALLAFANLIWLLVAIALVVSVFGIFGVLMPKPLLILLAILTFSRRILRRIIRRVGR